MITAQKAGHVCTHKIDKSELYAEDVQLIEAIIGLPANIFFGTGIPTIIMVLKRTRSDSDILIIDASKKFEKVGKNNKLRARDIREIVDTLKARKSVTKFAKLVTKDDIRKNEYNLNIPRYVDSSDDEEP